MYTSYRKLDPNNLSCSHRHPAIADCHKIRSHPDLRMLADGNADYARALGLDLDLSARGLGVRSQRFSMLVEDGVVKILNLEQPGKFEVSGAENMLQQLGG